MVSLGFINKDLEKSVDSAGNKLCRPPDSRRVRSFEEETDF
jgi:hypothetical protein